MELRQLEYFVAVAEERSFTRGAERVHVAQPGVSAQIRRLERELGEPLLDRSGRTVRVTAVGEAVLPYAYAALEAAAGARLAVDEQRGLVRGRVAVGMVVALRPAARAGPPRAVPRRAPGRRDRAVRGQLRRPRGRPPHRPARPRPDRARRRAARRDRECRDHRRAARRGGPARTSARGAHHHRAALARSPRARQHAARHGCPRGAGSRMHRCRDRPDGRVRGRGARGRRAAREPLPLRAVLPASVAHRHARTCTPSR